MPQNINAEHLTPFYFFSIQNRGKELEDLYLAMYLPGLFESYKKAVPDLFNMMFKCTKMHKFN